MVGAALFERWKMFFEKTARLDAAVVRLDKWCDCGHGRDLKTGLPRFFHVFYFNDGELSGWACSSCKHPAYPDVVPEVA